MAELDVFRAPASVAVVGASADPAKWGHWLARGACAGAHRRRVHLVNTGGRTVLGRETARSLSELPEVPELVAFAVPAATLPSAVDEALALGVPGLLAITAGVPDADRLAERVGAAGARLIGPNCLGLYDADAELELAWGRFTPGALAIVSQSGQLGLELSGLAAAAGIGVSRFVSVGDQVDVAAHEVLADLVDHGRTCAVAVYLESFGDGPRFLAALDALRRAGKPVMVLTVGASAAARQAARSHTGSLVTGLDVVDAACRSVGALRVDTPAALVHTAQLLVRAPRVAGRRVVIVGDSGGQGALAADVASRAGLDVVPLPEPVRRAVRDYLPPAAAAANPIDLAGAGEQDLSSYRRLVADLVAARAADAVLLTGYFGSYGQDIPSEQAAELAVAAGICAAGRQLPVVVHSMAERTGTTEALRTGGVPTYGTVEAAVEAIAAAAALGERPTPRTPLVPAGPAGPVDGYLAGRELLAAAGVSFPPARAVRNETELAAAAGELTAPYVLKADWVRHKTEHGAVAVGLPDLAAARAALRDMSERLGPGTFVLEELDRRPHTVELIVGARRDPTFGPVVLVGAGGVQAELLRDTALDLADLDRSGAHALIRRLRCLPLLHGWRGRPAVDLEALADVILAVARVLRDRPDLLDLELNPVRLAPDGALAVDVLVTAPTTDTPPRGAADDLARR